MFCKACGKEIDDDSKFCMYCGTRQSVKKVSEDQGNLNKKAESNIQNIDSHSTNEQPVHESYKTEIKQDYQDKYDRSYHGDLSASLVGLVVLIVNSTFFALTQISYSVPLSTVSALILVIFWIVAIFWVVNIAKRQNRNSIGWGIFAFCLPYLAIIIIGFLRKKTLPYNFNTYSQGRKSRYLNDLAHRLAKENHILSAEYFINQAIVWDPDNHHAFDTRGYIKFLKKEYKSSIEDFNTSIDMNENFGEKYYNRGNSKYNLDDLEGAISDWEKAVELDYSPAKQKLEKYANK